MVYYPAKLKVIAWGLFSLTGMYLLFAGCLLAFTQLLVVLFPDFAPLRENAIGFLVPFVSVLIPLVAFYAVAAISGTGRVAWWCGWILSAMIHIALAALAFKYSPSSLRIGPMEGPISLFEFTAAVASLVALFQRKQLPPLPATAG